MTDWLYKVKQNKDNIIDCIDYYEKEYEDARKEVVFKGKIAEHSANLSGQYEFRYGQLQELEAILKYLEIQLAIERGRKYKELLETYKRALTSADLKQYVEIEDSVILLNILVNEAALIRNKFLSITKGFEIKGFQLNNVIKLASAGIEDIQI